MKRLLSILLIGALLLCLVGCSRSVGGRYKLETVTSDGMTLLPSALGLNVSFQLEADGVGTAEYSGSSLDITWEEKDGNVIITGPNGSIELLKDGKNLVLHGEGTLLFFKPVEEEADD